MITGKGSIWKMAALFGLVLLAVLDIIFCAQNIFVEWLNGLLVAGTLLWIAVNKYKRWSDDNNG